MGGIVITLLMIILSLSGIILSLVIFLLIDINYFIFKFIFTYFWLQ